MILRQQNQSLNITLDGQAIQVSWEPSDRENVKTQTEIRAKIGTAKDAFSKKNALLRKSLNKVF